MDHNTTTDLPVDCAAEEALLADEQQQQVEQPPVIHLPLFQAPQLPTLTITALHQNQWATANTQDAYIKLRHDYTFDPSVMQFTRPGNLTAPEWAKVNAQPPRLKRSLKHQDHLDYLTVRGIKSAALPLLVLLDSLPSGTVVHRLTNHALNLLATSSAQVEANRHNRVRKLRAPTGHVPAAQH